MNPTSHCPESTIFEYLDGELTPSEQDDFERHLSTCVSCSTQVDEMRALYARLESLPETPMVRDLSPSVVSAIRAQSHPQTATRTGLTWLLLMQAAAALLLLAIVGPFVMGRLPLPDLYAAQISMGSATAIADLALRWQDRWHNLLDWTQQTLLLAEHTLSAPAMAAMNLFGSFCIVAVLLLWLAGNSYLLSAHPTTYHRRKS